MRKRGKHRAIYSREAEEAGEFDRMQCVLAGDTDCTADIQLQPKESVVKEAVNRIVLRQSTQTAAEFRFDLIDGCHAMQCLPEQRSTVP